MRFSLILCARNTVCSPAANNSLTYITRCGARDQRKAGGQSADAASRAGHVQHAHVVPPTSRPRPCMFYTGRTYVVSPRAHGCAQLCLYNNENDRPGRTHTFLFTSCGGNLRQDNISVNKRTVPKRWFYAVWQRHKHAAVSLSASSAC